MPKIAPVIIAAVAAIAALNPVPARAQANRTFVSGFGSDSNNCSFQNPCRSFAAALAVTNAKGEIAVLDSADYGAVTIGKSVSIVNDGVGVASITNTVANAAAVKINTGASDVVNLRGLTLTGADAGLNAIQFNTGGAVNIQNCVIRGFTKSAIEFQPQQSSTLTVLDTVVSNNDTSGGNVAAIDILPISGSSTTVNVYLGRVQVSDSGGSGINVDGSNQVGGSSLTVTIADSVVTANPNGNGVAVSGGFTNPAATLISTRLTNNAIGLFASGGATAYLAETVISGNSSNGFVKSGATIKTFGNNRITDTNNSGSLTATAKQ